MWNNEKRLRTFNNYLTVVVVLLSGYLIVVPFLPSFQLWLNKLSDDTGGVRYSGLLAQQNNATGDLRDAPTDSRLVIPSISLDEKIVIGEDPSNVHLGAWHRPKTSTPDQGGNTVIVGHRFSYSDPAVFYHMDKVALGDTFAIWWEGKEYVYEVFETVIVSADAIEIEGPTTEPIATLYTCTPIWTATNRLVVKGKLIHEEAQ